MLQAQALARNWWALVIRGMLGIIFGLIAFVWPGVTLTALVLVFGAYIFVDGIFALIAAFSRGLTNIRWPMLVEGLLGIIAGVIAFLWPAAAILALLFLLAAWAIVTGIFELVAAFQLRRELENEWLLGLSGIASIIFGILLAIFPGAGGLAVIWILGAYALVFGILLVVLGLRLRTMYTRTHGI
jgi:uncharacterized membrane protein HdeD (DUF308 family)